MKFRSLHKWDNKEDCVSLIYVAQLIDELLFDFTLDTYKPSAMNTSLLVTEALVTIKAIDSGSVKKPNLPHILTELCENLKKDEVAKSLLSVDLSGILKTLQNPKSTDQSIATTIELLLNQIPLTAYKTRNERLLISEVTGSGEFSKLRSLARSYVTTLLNFGYSHKYIHDVSRQFFFYSSDRIGSNEAINDYISIFSSKKDKYQILYRVPMHLNSFEKSAKRLGIIFPKDITEFADGIKSHSFNLGSKDVYLLFGEIEGKDPYVAKSKSDYGLELFQTLVGLYHHKESPAKIVECLVFDRSKDTCRKVSRSINPMHKCADSKIGVASKKLSEFMSSFSMKNESFRKFNRSAELHALALSSESRENQMINLWIALESLIPNKPEEEKSSQIQHIISSMLPFLNLSYINKIVLRFYKDLWNWDSKLARGLLKKIDAEGYLMKIMHFFCLSKYQNLRTELEKSTKDFHLFKDRFEYIQYVLSSPANLAIALDGHTRRIEWQIRRIYRARNLIVHDGKTPSYTDVLIENTHDYLDSIMNKLMSLASTEDTVNSIDQGFKMMELNYSSYYAALSQKGIQFNDNNINDLLLKNTI